MFFIIVIFILNSAFANNHPAHIYSQQELFSLPLADDLALNIVDFKMINSNLESLDRLKLTSASLKKIPWADSYWPIYKGLIGIRYADAKFPNSKNFEDNLNYIVQHPASAIVESGNQIEIDQLSPAEKYDLLVGDQNWTMTNYVWNQGKSYYENLGFIPQWMGICHGWSAASHMNAAVSHKPIVVEFTQNKKITFYPSDMKALLSLLWANASPVTRFVGTKCQLTAPKRNSIRNINSNDCQNNNPATFHLILTNQLGLNQRSFVMDATYDSEVWNFPLTAYKYKYFNPKTLEPTRDFKSALISVEQFTSDPFKEYRDAQVRFVIGIVMDDTYVVEIFPSQSSQSESPLKTTRHYYDLELDAQYNIIGGEWYSQEHPDFIWTYDEKAQALSISDSQIQSEEWGLSEAVPLKWTALAQKASNRGQPIYAIIKSILARE